MSPNGDSGAGGAAPRRKNVTPVVLVAAVARNGVIGARGKLPWHLPEDLAHFKRTTLGRPIVMGRRTWDSLGRALPGRRNVVVTRRADFPAPGAETASTLQEAIARCAGADAVFVIGGAELYRAALPLADAMELTEIGRDYEGDTRFPDWDRADWRIARQDPHASADGVPFRFVRYERAMAPSRGS